jgi:DNA-binding MarR family transcriptional regulator
MSMDEQDAGAVVAIGGRRARQVGLLAWIRLARIYQRVDRATTALMRRWNLSVAQFDVLTQVGLREGISQQELADQLLVTKGNVSQLIAKMERRGLVRRCQEGRSMCLFLTDEGWRLYREAVPAQEAMIAGRFGGLSAEEGRELLALLRRVDQALE